MPNRNVKLVCAMARKGMNDADLAEATGISRMTVNRLKNKATPGRMDTWLKIAKALGVELSEIVEIGE
jgi:DNA-binding Xre family transcriptional regulator